MLPSGQWARCLQPEAFHRKPSTNRALGRATRLLPQSRRERHAGYINRTVLDQLRGSLHRFKAFRGTIISTGSFSAGAKNAALEVGAAPITLIDGDKLLDLLIENSIGVSKKALEYYEFDDSKLLEFEEVNTPLEKEA